MTGETRFSIIVPTYNRARLISDTLLSLLQQQYSNYEIIVVDDGSTDNTGEVVRGMNSEKIVYFKKENGERAAARNFGIQKASGDYITFLDSDDLLYSNALSVANEVIRDLHYPDFLHIGYETGTKEKISRKIDRLPDNDPMVLRDGNPLSCLGIFIKKEITRHHLFNEDRQLTGSEDWEYWLRLAANFGLRTDNRVIGRLIEHDERSVINISEEQLVKRRDLSINYAFKNEAVRKIYDAYRKRMEAFWNIYIALHLAMSKKRGISLKYLVKSFFQYPGVILHRRFFSVIKKIVL